MSHNKARLFTAIRIPDALKNKLHHWMEHHKGQLPFRNRTHQDDYHITLQFLGDTEPALIDKLHESLQEAANQVQPFPLKIGEPGVFGSKEVPRVLWRGVEGELDSLFSLQQSIVQSTIPLGFVPEDRPYRPHITTARKFNQELRRSFNLDELADGAWDDTWMVEEFVLYKTNMGQKPMYEMIGNYVL
ncbi:MULTISPECIES: RNA 2',3'-cyclic phosphodiesterase [unclassified Paenibacillus]|uniref:RNA 2',3'-cyclic phosphodiesterase n=1 Tax=Paenibacillus provencensis TaxID=441151 RepID=A0ABW3Q5C3_9BACL|nr:MULTISPECIES: RNA 2',3'-cyclic phosphodiesterase [unclassified Paenibacillus]MCM3127733.1 RNA 2',3'-cyclic phosphodiesterase [Paenibacillus sp. MER 78]SFS38677.1 2'-5' RNA ligase [Paenibacillus sp. 453mf]